MKLRCTIYDAIVLVIGICCFLADDAIAGRELPPQVLVNGVGFIHIPAGEFWHHVPEGRATTDNRMPYNHRDVEIWQDGFYMAKYEARARDFLRFMNSDATTPRLVQQYIDGNSEGCTVRLNALGEYYLVSPEQDLPATHLSWELADAMANWLGFRLPTEAEWVKAARGPDKRLWPWGFEYPDDTFAAYHGDTDCPPLAVDGHPNGVSFFGVHSMSGNVSEFVADWYNTDFYRALKTGDRNVQSKVALQARSDLSGEINPLKLLKGGRWSSSEVYISLVMWIKSEFNEAASPYGARFAIDESAVQQLLDSGDAIAIHQK